MKSLVIIGIIMLGCSTAIALEEHLPSPSPEGASGLGPVDNNPSSSLDATILSDPYISGSAQIAQGETTAADQSDQNTQPQTEPSQAGQQAPIQPAPQDSPQPTVKAAQQTPSISSSSSSTNTDSSASHQSTISAPKVTHSTETKTSNEKKEVTTEAPSDHSVTSPPLVSDHQDDHDHDLGAGNGHSKDKPEKQDFKSDDGDKEK